MIEQTRRHTLIAARSASPTSSSRSTRWTSSTSTRPGSTRSRRPSPTSATGSASRTSVAIPIAALTADNVVERSERMPWWNGATFLEHLEGIEIASDRNAARPTVPRPVGDPSDDDDHHDYRGYAGEVAGGEWRAGDDVVVLPSGLRTTVAVGRHGTTGRSTWRFRVRPSSIRLDDELDVARGDMLCDPADPPVTARELEATVCWMSERPVEQGGRLGVKHTTRWARAIVDEIVSVLDIETLEQHAAQRMELNDLGPCAAPARSAAPRRPLRRQPRHRCVHPRRRGDERHRRRRHGRRRHFLTRCLRLQALRQLVEANTCSIVKHGVPRGPVPERAQPRQGHALRLVVEPLHRAARTAARSVTSARSRHAPSGLPTTATAARSGSRSTSPTCSGASSRGRRGSARASRSEPRPTPTSPPRDATA